MNVHTLFLAIANVHIVTTDKGILVVDAGMPHTASLIVRRIRALGYSPQDVRLILVTHGHIDHAGSAVKLKRLTGAPIAMHRGDMPLVATPGLKIPPGRNAMMNSIGKAVSAFGWAVPLETFVPDVCVQDGQGLGDFDLAARVVHTPGHTDGSISLLFEDGTMFVGDSILNMIRVSFSLWMEDASLTRASAQKILACRPRLCYPGHGRAFSLQQLEAFVRRNS